IDVEQVPPRVGAVRDIGLELDAVAVQRGRGMQSARPREALEQSLRGGRANAAEQRWAMHGSLEDRRTRSDRPGDGSVRATAPRGGLSGQDRSTVLEAQGIACKVTLTVRRCPAFSTTTSTTSPTL